MAVECHEQTSDDLGVQYTILSSHRRQKGEAQDGPLRFSYCSGCPNLGRRSTYRCGKSVSDNRATSLSLPAIWGNAG
jgi:hypothetical protein